MTIRLAKIRLKGNSRNMENGSIAGILCALSMGAASAATIDEAVRSIAQARTSSSVAVDSRVVDAVYVGEVMHHGERCTAVALPSHTGKFDQIENFRVCGERVERVDDVSPAWLGDAQGKALVISAVQNAIRLGSGQANYNGYNIAARALNAVNSHCKIIEVLISYDGNLVDRAEKQMCQ